MRRQHEQNWAIEQRGTGAEGRAATNRCIDLAVSIRGHGSRRCGLVAAVVAELRGPSQSQLRRKTNGRVKARPLQCRGRSVMSTFAERGPKLRGRRGERDKKKGRKGAQLSCHRWLSVARVLSSGTVPGPCTSRHLGRRCSCSTQYQDAEAAARVYCRVGALLQESSRDRCHEEGVAQETRKARPRVDGAIYYINAAIRLNGLNRGIRVLRQAGANHVFWPGERVDLRVATSRAMG